MPRETGCIDKTFTAARIGTNNGLVFFVYVCQRHGKFARSQMLSAVCFKLGSSVERGRTVLKIAQERFKSANKEK